MDTTATIAGSGGAFLTDDVTEPATEDVATDDVPAGVDAGWEDVTVVPASSVGMETPLETYEAFLVSVASWDNAAACSLISADFVAEMQQETAQGYITEDGAATDGSAGCVQSLDATLEWFDLDQVRESGTNYTVVGVTSNTQHELDTRTPQQADIGISGSGVSFEAPADERIGEVVLSYVDGLGWQVAGLH